MTDRPLDEVSRTKNVPLNRDLFRGKGGPETVEGVLDVPGDSHRVGAVLTLNDEHYARLTHDRSIPDRRGRRDLHLGHIPQLHPDTALVRHDDSRKLLPRAQLPFGIDDNALIVVLE